MQAFAGRHPAGVRLGGRGKRAVEQSTPKRQHRPVSNRRANRRAGVCHTQAVARPVGALPRSSFLPVDHSSGSAWVLITLQGPFSLKGTTPRMLDRGPSGVSPNGGQAWRPIADERCPQKST